MKKLFLVLACLAVGFVAFGTETEMGFNLDFHSIEHVYVGSVHFKNVGVTMTTAIEVSEYLDLDFDFSLRGLIGLTDEDSRPIYGDDLSGSELSWKYGFSLLLPSGKENLQPAIGFGCFCNLQTLRLDDEREFFTRNGSYVKCGFKVKMKNDYYFNIYETLYFTGAVRPEIPSERIMNFDIAIGFSKRLDK